jgi:branched-chain amino acid transport system permease protein
VLVVRPLRHAPRIRPLVGTFAVGTLFYVFAVRRWGLDPHPSGALVRGDGIQLAGLTIVPGQLLILAVSVVVMVGLWAIYRYTAFGLRLRATAIDPGAAGLVGVNINRTSMATWALAGAIGGLSAILIAPLVSFNTAFMTTLAIRGLAAALLGGLSNIGGTFGAGIAIGVAEAVLAYQSPVSGITDVTLSALLLVVLIVRPTGLLRSAY